MSYGREAYGDDIFAADAAADVRGAFIRRTYGHLFGAILGFVGLTAFFLTLPNIDNLMFSFAQAKWAPIILMLGFMGAATLAQSFAQNSSSQGAQYFGLGLYTLAEAVIFTPMMWYASKFVGPDVIPTAGMLTLTIFGGLTLIVMVTGADFSFLRTGLMLAGWAALGLVVAGWLFGFTLGLFFAYAMCVLASGYILYDTSNVLHHYRTDQHVGAALALFASVALLFWYILQIVMSFSKRD